MAQVHSRAVVAAAGQPAGVCSSTRSSAVRASEAFGLGPAYDSLDQMLDGDSIDVVHVCSPNATHAPAALAALAAGKHVICEKPLAVSVAEATALTRAADTSGRLAAVPLVYRYYPMVREARHRITAGRGAPLLSIQGSYTQDWLLSDDNDNWRTNAGQNGSSRAFADVGSHLCDLVEFVTGSRITALAATSAARPAGRPEAGEDVAALVVEMDSGAIGTLTVSQVSPGRKNRLAVEIASTSETVAFDQEDPERLWVGSRDDSRVLVRDPDRLSADASRLSVLPAGHPQGYQDAFNAFIADAYAAIRDGHDPDGLPRFADGLRAARLTEAVQRSTALRSWVTTPHDFPSTETNRERQGQ